MCCHWVYVVIKQSLNGAFFHFQSVWTSKIKTPPKKRIQINFEIHEMEFICKIVNDLFFFSPLSMHGMLEIYGMEFAE